MRPVLRELLDLLRLERLAADRFVGQSQDLGWGSVFGGQVLSQALHAAGETVPPDRPVHSLHASFLRQGDTKQPIVYEVDRIRDGGSFTTRRVVAFQAEHAIFSCSASFQREEVGLTHQAPMPETAGPEGFASEAERARRIADRIPEGLREQAIAERPIEIRVVTPYDPLEPVAREPERRVWCRASDRLPDDPALHRYLLAYASDFHLLTTSLQPHGISWLTPGLQIASLDHAMWFHRPFRMDDWLLHAIESPSASGGRGLVRSQFFDRSGALVASTAQEGLVRLRRGDRA
jgi:acyl-CoA thioesterase-2